MSDHSGHYMTMDDQAPSSPNSSAFCDSSMAMVMYMDGFQFGLVGQQPCLNLYFATWTLNTVGKYVGAMIGVFLLALAVEGISKFRQLFVRSARSKPWSGRTVRTSVTLLHGFQAFLGYIVMLAVMTYSAELLIMTIAGLATGYAVFFNIEDDLDGTHVTTNPCCNFMMDEAKEGTHGVAGTAANSDAPYGSSIHECCGSGDDVAGVGEGGPL